MILVFGGFGLVGSAALVWWVLADEAALSRQDFLADGRSNAAFISNTGLPASPQMARQLGEVLGVEVRFRTEDAHFIPAQSNTPPWRNLPASVPMETVITRSGWEMLAVPLRSGQELWLARPAKPAWHGILRPGALTGLGVFWAALLALAVGISRTIVRPVRALAGTLPGLSGDSPLVIPKVAQRNDEIGSLAEGLAATHALLVSERQKRLESERMALLGRMAAGLAHEINNPAAAIRLHAQLLARALPADSGSGQSALTIASEAGRIEELVNQWLFLTRPAPPQISRVPLHTLLQESLAAAAPAAEHAGLTLTISDIPEGAAVPGDSRRLRQVLGNLLTNAIHASPEGGTVALEVRAAPGPRWEIVCRDSGQGFSPEALTKGTELFFSEKEGGLGIGLSVSSEIAAAHGGTLLLTNAPSGGVVTLQLPVA
jgi:signal transduction histidine kinase